MGDTGHKKPCEPIAIREIASFEQFYTLMAQTRATRAYVVEQLLADEPLALEALDSLKNALVSLEQIPKDEGTATLLVNQRDSAKVNINYETTELYKDMVFLEHGEEALLHYLEEFHPQFREWVNQTEETLYGNRFNCWITDRDGTTNNYCERYRTSVQSIYNAVFVTRFARACANHRIFVTAAPLSDPGIADLSINPPGTFIYAASKGREFIDLSGQRHVFPIDPERREMLAELNRRIQALLRRPGRRKFYYLGSGLQFKFGQTTVARQGFYGSVSATESLAFLNEIRQLVGEIDPGGEFFQVEDLETDVDITLTIDDSRRRPQDFTKGFAVEHLDPHLGLEMSRGPHLVSGDTASDLSLLEATLAKSLDTYAVFVTTDPELSTAVQALCPRSVFVPSPDVLVTALNSLSKQELVVDHVSS